MRVLFKGKVLLISPVIIGMHSLLLMTKNGLNFGLVKTFLTHIIPFRKYFLWLGTMLHRQIKGIPIGASCANLLADFVLFCYERDFRILLSADTQAAIIKAFNSTTRYLDDLLDIDNSYFKGTVTQIYPAELQLNKANFTDIEAAFFRFSY